MRKPWICIWMLMLFSVSTLRGQGPQLPPVPRVPISSANGIEVSPAVKQDESPALRSISPLVVRATTANNEHFLGKPHPNPKSTSPDGAVQTASGPKVATTDGLNFLGVGQGFVGPAGAYQVQEAPPDANGAVGATQYVQWVNRSFAVFDKVTGAVVYGPAAGNTLWSGFGGGCETNNDGDIIAQYDKSADRWVMAQPAFVAPYLYCIAVSTTSDATSSYFRYAFSMPNFPDYPKLGVWESGFFGSFNMFNGNTFVGARACAFDRARMIAGATATAQCVPLSPSFDSLLPADTDGRLVGLTNGAEYYLNLGTNSLNLWQFHADWANPANSTFTGPANIPVAPFSDACGGGVCIPQSGTAQTLDSLGDRLMYRLAFRAFDNGSGGPSCCHQSLVAVHSVTVGNRVGLRWYELRSSQGSPFSLFQQGTYAPDSNYRWMGSIGMDRAGDIALGYSVSGSSIHPGIRYTGRVPTDALGTLESENSIVEGGGSQSAKLDRWGDYSSINIDPMDDCTFWYTNEYLQTNGTFNWSTRIGSFKFSNCVPSNQPPSAVSVSPSSGSGSSQVFHFLFSDPDGVLDLNFEYILVNNTLGATNGCVVLYFQAGNALLLLNDAGNAWLGPARLFSGGTLQNSQCTVDVTSSSASSSGTNLTLNLALSFTAAFLGPKNIFMYATDDSGLNSGWQSRGGWTVTPAVDHPPQAVAVTPSSGTGSSQLFNFRYSDPDGFGDLNVVFVVINSTAGTSNGCVIGYIESSNQLLLLNDAGDTWLAPATPGAAGALQNSQCTVNLPGSSVSTSGTNLTLNLPLSFSHSFSGTQTIFMYAADNSEQNSGWQTPGTWTVP